jgi:rhodanese-related sulfurtransferase
MVRSITPRELDDAICGEERLLLLDVRSRNEHALHPEAIPGSQWRDPAAVGTWLPAIPEGTSAVVYCAGGGEASRGIQSRLAARGVTARYLEGGLAAWQRQHGGEHGEPGGLGGQNGLGGRTGEGCAHSPVRGEPGGHIPAGGESGLHRPAGNGPNGQSGQPGRRGSEAGGHQHARGGRSEASGGMEGDMEGGTGGGSSGGEGGGAR